MIPEFIEKINQQPKAVKRVVILGHSGFIGTHLEQGFKEWAPDVDVLGRSLPDLDLTKADECAKLGEYFNEDTAVLMLAAIKRQFGDTLDVYEQNMQMAMNLTRVLMANPVKRMIYFSSAAVYGEDVHNTNITEDTPVFPTSYYGMAKYSAERVYRKEFLNMPDSSLVCLRPPLIYGPGDMGRTYGPAGFIKTALEGEQITLWGDGTELRDFIYVQDAVQAVYALTFNDFEGVLNLVSGNRYNFKDVLDSVEQLIGEPLKLSSRDRSKAKVDNQFSNAKISEVLSGFQMTPLAKGVELTFKYESQQYANQS